jgi:hypothetical protein
VKKKFDCVAMMHRGAARIYEETKNMTIDEEVAYWKEKDAALGKRRGGQPTTRPGRLLPMKTKTFDCVEMKRRGAALIYEKIKDMTIDEQVAYWKEKDAAFENRRTALRRRRARSLTRRSRKRTV